MSWFFSRPKSREEKPGRRGLEGLISGIHRAPALAVLVDELRRHPPQAVLDLGPSSTDSVAFLSPFCDNISIHDVFGSTTGVAGARSTIFRFGRDVLETLASEDETFDVVLLWDLLHYFERSDLEELATVLADRCRPGALVYLLASAVAPVPLTPIRFRFHPSGELKYEIPSDERVAPPDLRTRDVEKALAAFEPLRLFQLRNGLQEFLFRFREPSEPEARDAVTGEVPEVEEAPFLFD